MSELFVFESVSAELLQILKGMLKENTIKKSLEETGSRTGGRHAWFDVSTWNNRRRMEVS